MTQGLSDSASCAHTESLEPAFEKGLERSSPRLHTRSAANKRPERTAGKARPLSRKPLGAPF
jgi:hypothetical protein